MLVNFPLLMLIFSCESTELDNTETTDQEIEITNTIQTPTDVESYQVIPNGRFTSSDERITIVSNSQLFPDYNLESYFELNATPSLTGYWERISDTQLAFYPENLKPETSYSIQIKREAFEATTTLVTSEFSTFDKPFIYRSGESVKVSAIFSAAITCDEVVQRLKLKTALGSIKANQCEKGSYPNDIRLTYDVPSSIKSVSLSGKVNAANGDQVLNISHEAKLKDSKPVSIVTSAVQEAGDGYIMRVFCDDESIESRRWVWDREMDFDEQISTRCQIPPDQLKAHVKVEPSVGSLDFLSTRHGFHILGDFKKGDYTLTINAGMVSVDGGIVAESYRSTLTVDSHRARVSFIGNGRYLPRAAWNGVPIRYRNVDGLDLEIRRVPTENINSWESRYSDEVYEHDGDIIHTSKLETESKDEQFHTLWLNLNDRLSNLENGVYEIRVSNKNSHVRTAMWVVVSDIQLIAKRDTADDGRLNLWALNTNTLAPVNRARLSVHRPSGTEDSYCFTNAEGYCSLASASRDDLGNNRQHMIVARKDEDFTYMNLSNLRVSEGSFSVFGQSYNAERKNIAIHTERGAYRPGDTAYIFAIARNESHHALANTDIELLVRDAQANQVFRQTLTTNSAGAIEAEVDIPDFASTGQWSILLNNLDEEIEGSASFYVEELMPERMELGLTASRRNILRGEALDVAISGRYLFGAIAANDAFELTCTVYPTVFKPSQNQNYQFPNATFDEFILGSVRGELDENGKANVECPSMERLAALDSTARLGLQLSVFEGGSGRASRKSTSVTIHPSQNYVGLKASDYSLTAGQSVVFNGIVVDWNGERIKTEATVAIDFSTLEDGYAWTFDPSTGGSHYERRELPQTTISESLSLKNGAFVFTTIPTERADGYELSVRSEGAQGRLRMNSRYWSDDETAEPSRPDTLSIKLPNFVSLGEAFSAQVNVPYTGMMLWSIESDTMHHSQWVKVEEIGPQTWDTTLSEMPFTENVYVSALLIKDPHSESIDDFIPARSFGTAPLMISPDDYSHEVTLTLPDEISPNDPLKVGVDLGGKVEEGTVVFVQAVDEGLLSLTDFVSPNPFEQVFLRRALGVTTHETVGWTQMSIGGSQAMGGGASSNGERPDVVKPVTLWSGIQAVPTSGKVDVEFDVPRYNGKLRVMVVSAGPKRIGHASDKVIVKEPIVVQTTLPRFLIRDDIVQIPVRLTNTTDAKQDVQLSLQLSDPSALTIMSAKDASIPLEAGEAKTVAFQAKVLAESGSATVSVKAESKVYTAIDEQVVPFNSNRPRERRTTRVELTRGKTDITSVMEGWVADETNIWVTTNPYGQALAHASHIIRYPYGCVEQTSSSLRPLISSSGLYKLIDPVKAKDVDIDKMVAHGIKRLSSMQTSDGGLSYWPGGYRSHPWGTAYATHVLLDAKASQHEVPDHVIDRALQYLSSYLTNDDPYYRNAKAYAHYLLARSGKGNTAAIRAEIIRNYHPEDDFLLKAALYHSGDRTYESELRGLTGTANISKAQRHYYFGSRLRTTGLMLSVHQELFGNSEPAGDMVASNIVSLLNRSSRYYSTQELAWSVYALAKRTEGLGSNVGDAELLVSGQSRELTTDNGDDGRSWGVWNASEYELKIKLPKLEGKAYAFVTTQGARLDGEFEFGGSSLLVLREFVNHEGKPVDLTSQNLGDLVYVRTTIKNTSSKVLTELALVDRLPAGWEIENANLGGADNASILATKDLWQVEHQNIRDNRLEAFGDLNPGQVVQVVYAARASLGGTFQLPPVEVEAMYDSSVWARIKGGVVTIETPWSGSFL